MLSSNLLELLGKFTSAEMKEFGEFVSSPFFNKNENVIRLFRYIKKYYPDLQNKKLEKEYAFAKIFEKQKYNDGYIRTLMFKLQKLAEEYLSYNNYRQKQEEIKIGLLDELNKRKLEKAFLKNLSEREKEFEESKYKGYGYFHYKIELEQQKQFFYNWTRYKSKDFRDYTDESFFNSIDYVISAFLIRVMSKYRFLLAKEYYQKIEFNSKFLDSLVDYLSEKDNRYKTNPVISLHLNEILLMKTGDVKYYYILKEMLVDSKERLSADERYSLHNVINQYAVLRQFAGDESFKRERFQLYSIALEQKIYKGTGDVYFDDIYFGSIVMSGIQNGQFEWTEEFIENYKDELPPDNKTTVINFCHARVSFARKDFAMALKHLSRIRTIKAIQYKTAIRDLTLMTYFEMNMFSQAYFLADSYRHFLAKNKSHYSDSRFERMSNFLKFFLKITKLKENMNLNDLDELIFETGKTTNIMEREWLLGKIKELETS